MRRLLANGCACVVILAAPALQSLAADAKVAAPLTRQGDEILVCGQFFHTGTPVVLWIDPGGYDAYRVEPRFAPLDAPKPQKKNPDDEDSPNRYNTRTDGLTPAQIERVRGGGWDLPLLQGIVDQFVIHYDVCGTSRRCFEVLQDLRHLSVHFMLDLDGTIYQTLDLKERAWHAGNANDRSVGVEIANMGAYGADEKSPFAQWYVKDGDGKTRIAIPDPPGKGGIRNPQAILRPFRPAPIVGKVHGRELTQYDLTPQQYEALTKLTAALCKVFPKIRCDYPRQPSGAANSDVLSVSDYGKYQGVLGHYNLHADKVDPGPAFQWELVIGGARKLLKD